MTWEELYEYRKARNIYTQNVNHPEDWREEFEKFLPDNMEKIYVHLNVVDSPEDQIKDENYE